jgi:hypothetical protein
VKENKVIVPCIISYKKTKYIHPYQNNPEYNVPHSNNFEAIVQKLEHEFYNPKY